MTREANSFLSSFAIACRAGKRCCLSECRAARRKRSSFSLAGNLLRSTASERPCSCRVPGVRRGLYGRARWHLAGIPGLDEGEKVVADARLLVLLLARGRDHALEDIRLFADLLRPFPPFRRGGRRDGISLLATQPVAADVLAIGAAHQLFAGHAVEQIADDMLDAQVPGVEVVEADHPAARQTFVVEMLDQFRDRVESESGNAQVTFLGLAHCHGSGVGTEIDEIIDQRLDAARLRLAGNERELQRLEKRSVSRVVEFLVASHDLLEPFGDRSTVGPGLADSVFPVPPRERDEAVAGRCFVLESAAGKDEGRKFVPSTLMTLNRQKELVFGNRFRSHENDVFGGDRFDVGMSSGSNRLRTDEELRLFPFLVRSDLKGETERRGWLDDVIDDRVPAGLVLHEFCLRRRQRQPERPALFEQGTSDAAAESLLPSAIARADECSRHNAREREPPSIGHRCSPRPGRTIRISRIRGTASSGTRRWRCRPSRRSDPWRSRSR